MKKVSLWILLTIMGMTSSFAQVTLGRTVFGCCGMSVTVGGTNYNYTIGEAVIGTKIGALPQLTIGFQQPIDNSLLPVTLLDFMAIQRGDDAEITWTTVWEMNSKTFVVERSVDRVNFQPVGQLPGAGESMDPRFYEWIDPGIVHLGSDVFYYRLRHIDLNGGYTFSQTEELRIVRQDQKVIVYPNPAQDQVTLQFSQDAEAIGEISLWNPLGQVIRRISFPELNAAQRFDFRVSDLSRGTYILKVNQAGKVYTFRLVLI